MPSRLARSLALAALVLPVLSAASSAQTFLKINGNAIATSGGDASMYGGASWIDADGDGDLELFINGVGLFRNDGGGAFTLLTGAITPILGTLGNTWADVDNDGDLDVYLSGVVGVGSSLFLNQGGLTFSRITTGAIGNAAANVAWGCAFGDYDVDGAIDLVTAAAFGFGGIDIPNRLFHNDGSGDFTQVDDTPITQNLAPFTIPSWSDYDLDGDPDLFIGTGPANGTVALDYLFRNRHESAPGTFERITDAPLGTDLQDGQVYNWIDYDNDGDLDVYLTNYIGTTSAMANRLYRNVGGTFVAQTFATAGTIVSDAQASLASVWQDFDNDGDLDCVVTNDGSPATRFYRNNGNGTFTFAVITNLSTAGPHFGAASGDYDDDGRMDLFVVGNATTFALLHNSTVNANHWLKVRLTGTVSNRAAIGARVRVRAIIGGSPVWQMRELSAQNSFNGMNALEAHFGLGGATVADSVVVEWPSGLRSLETDVPAEERRAIVEPAATSAPVSEAPGVLEFGIRSVPNPGRAPLLVHFALSSDHPATLELLDVMGRRVARAAIAPSGAGAGSARLAGSGTIGNGVYFVRLAQGGRRDVRRVVVMN